MSIKTTITTFFFEQPTAQHEQPLHELTIKYQTPKQDKPNNADLLSVIKQIAFLLAVYLYFTGWIYSYAYYQFFGLSAGQSGVPFYDYLILSYSVLEFIIGDGSWLFWILLLLLAANLLLRFFTRKILRQSITRCITLCALIAFFPLLFHYAKKTGIHNARFNAFEANSALPAIEIYSKQKPATVYPTDSLAYQRLLSQSDAGHLRLISATNDELFVLLFNPSDSMYTVPIIYRINKENLLYVKTYTNPTLIN